MTGDKQGPARPDHNPCWGGRGSIPGPCQPQCLDLLLTQLPSPHPALLCIGGWGPWTRSPAQDPTSSLPQGLRWDPRWEGPLSKQVSLQLPQRPCRAPSSGSHPCWCQPPPSWGPQGSFHGGRWSSGQAAPGPRPPRPCPGAVRSWPCSGSSLPSPTVCPSSPSHPLPSRLCHLGCDPASTFLSRSCLYRL